MPSVGVVLLRLRDERVHNKINNINYLITNYFEKLKNSFIVVSEDKIRIRELK